MSDEGKKDPAPVDPCAASDKPPPAAGASTATFYPDEEPGSMIGAYKLLQKLGKGGMGVVWMAQQNEPVQRRVAIKIISAELRGDQVLARFEAERQALAMMDHPNIARVLDAGTTAGLSGASATAGGRPYFVMELVKGIPFTRYCDQEHLTLKERLELFIPVCQAVQHAHQKGVVHRDLKPSNVIIALYDGRPVPKVIDFGVAKATHQKLTEKTMFTEVGQIVGTLEYMAPEQAELNNLDIDTRADIYSLGVMLYEILTGTTPFSSKQLRSKALLEMLRIIREVEPAKPSTKLSSSEDLPAIAAKRKLEPKKLSRLVRGDLDWIVMKCLEKERARRYETANQLGCELQRFLADEPVQAGPPSVAYRATKFLRRNKGPVIAACLVFLALVAGIVGTSIGLALAESARFSEASQREIAQANEVKANHLAVVLQGNNEDLAAAIKKEIAAKAVALAREKDAADERDIARKETKRAEDEKKRAEDEKKLADLATAKALAAADKERLAKALADGRLTEIEKVNDLLESIFIDVDPRAEEKGGPLLREQLTKRLLHVADSLDEHAIRDPLTVARLQLFLGKTLYRLGEPGKSIEILVKSRSTREKLLGPDHPDTLTSMDILASGYTEAGKLDLAVPLFEQTLEKRKAKLGADDLDTLSTMNNLGEAYRLTGKLELAVSLLQETVKARKTKLGPDNHQTLTSTNNLGNAYIAVAKLDLAVPLLQETMERRRANLGPDHPDTLKTMSSLASAYVKSGNVGLALPLYLEALEKRKAKIGADHPDTLLLQNNLGAAYQAAGKLELALPLLQETLAKQKAKIGPDHPHTLTTMSNLALAYRAAGKMDLAVSLLQECMERLKAKLGPDHPDTLTSMNNLAAAYSAAGKLDLALPLYQDTLEKRKAKLGLDHPETLRSMSNLAMAYKEAGKMDLALPLMQETLEKQKAILGPDHPTTLTGMNNLAAAYYATGKRELALSLYEETMAKQTAKLGRDHPDTLLTMSNLANVYFRTGKRDLALPLFQETLEKRKAKLGPDHPRTLDSMEDLANGYWAAGKLEELALPLYREALEKRKARPPLDHPTTLAATKNLALVYLTVKQPDKAAPLHEEYLAMRRKQWGNDDPRYGGELAAVAFDLLKHDQHAAAEPMLRQSLQIRLKSQPDAWTTFNTKTMLGGSLLGQKKYQEAEPFLKDGYDGMKQREKTIPPQGVLRLTEALERLVQLYEAPDNPNRNPAEAERYRKELAARKKAEKDRQK